MNSIVLELQHAAMDKRTDVDDLLRKCVVIASKLKLEDFLNWAKRELDGYGKGDEIPVYRIVPGEVQAFNPYNGLWIPIVFQDEPPEGLRKRAVTQKVAEVKDLASKGKGILAMTLPDRVAYRLMESSDAPRPPVFVISKTSLHGVLDAVRNVILDWSLKLEADGILGEGMTFTTQEKQTAMNNTYNINNFTGVLGAGDNYSAGQAGSMGPNATAQDMAFQQVNGDLQNIDLDVLATELSSLREGMRRTATEPEHDIATAQIAAAEVAARKSDRATVARHLKTAGKWAFDVATKIGVSVASEAIKKSTGL